MKISSPVLVGSLLLLFHSTLFLLYAASVAAFTRVDPFRRIAVSAYLHLRRAARTWRRKQRQQQTSYLALCLQLLPIVFCLSSLKRMRCPTKHQFQQERAKYARCSHSLSQLEFKISNKYKLKPSNSSYLGTKLTSDPSSLSSLSPLSAPEEKGHTPM